MNRVHDLPLRDHRVLITRPRSQSQNLSELVRAAGGEAIIFPAVEIIQKQISDKEIRLLKGLVAGDILIFISRNAVRFLGHAFDNPANRFSGMTVLAVGPGTAEVLKEQGFNNVISPDRGSGSEAVLELGLLQEGSVRGKKIVILRGAGGRELLRHTLLQRGAEVDVVELYYRGRPSVDNAVVKKIWHQSPPDVIVITSGEGLKNLIDMTPKDERKPLFNTRLVVVSDRVRDLAISSGFKPDPQVAGNAGDEEMMQAIIGLFRGKTK